MDFPGLHSAVVTEPGLEFLALRRPIVHAGYTACDLVAGRASGRGWLEWPQEISYKRWITVGSGVGLDLAGQETCLAGGFLEPQALLRGKEQTGGGPGSLRCSEGLCQDSFQAGKLEQTP